MKKFLCAILALALIFGMLASCAAPDAPDASQAEPAPRPISDNVYIGGRFSDKQILNAEDAIAAIDSVRAELGFIGEAKDNFRPMVEDKLDVETFYRVEQVFGGVPVYGRNMVVIAGGSGEARELSGNYTDVSNLESRPLITEEAAVAAAKEFLDTEGVNYPGESPVSLGLTYYTFCDEPALCWHLSFSDIETVCGIFVNAVTGSITDTIKSPAFYAAATVDVKGQNGAKYTLPYRTVSGQNVLYDSDRNIAVKSLNYADIDDEFGEDGIELATGNKGSFIGTSGDNKSAADALGNIIGAYDFYKQILGREQYDGKGGFLPIYVNAEDKDYGYNAFFFHVGFIAFTVPTGDRGKEYSKNLDIVGHEFTHGVSQSTWAAVPVNNNYYADAMSEGISDIMGDMVERSVTGTNDWKIAGWSNRNMKDKKTNDDFINKDGNEYNNCRIVCHAAYKMWEGSSKFLWFGEDHKGVKECSDNTGVMSKLWYGVMLRLSPSATFWDCRRAAENSAASLKDQGLLSEEQVKTVGWAFDEIKIYDFGGATGIGSDWIETFSTPDDLAVTIGEAAVIEAATVPVIPPDGFSVEWAIADESVATVDKNGIIYALKKGETEITARALINGNPFINGREHIDKTTLRVTPIARDSILVLDISGSMAGTPLDEMKKSASAFCEAVLGDSGSNNRVGLVTYDTDVYTYDMTSDISSLKNTVDNLRDGSRTNLQGALQRAMEMMDAQGRPGSIKNIIVMTDGLPNEGIYSTYGQFSQKYSHTGYYTQYADSAFETAEQIMLKYNLYSLGYFHSLSGDEFDYARDIMQNIQNKGYYQLDNAEGLVFVFADMTTDISAGARLVINIACPVDVEINYGGERISSAPGTYSDYASFGTLQMLGKNKDIKVLTLTPGIDYTVEMKATDEGRMNYTMNYFDNNETITDSRVFPEVPLTPTTLLSSNTVVSEVTKLKIDTDGDGEVDMIWEAGANETGKQVWSSRSGFPDWGIWLLIFIFLAASAAIIALAVGAGKRKEKTGAPPPLSKISMLTKAQGGILILKGAMQGADIPISPGETLRIGRDASWANLVLCEGAISRRHCAVTFVGTEGCYYVRDESRHGTYISGDKRLPLNTAAGVEHSARLTLASDNVCILQLK